MGRQRLQLVIANFVLLILELLTLVQKQLGDWGKRSFVMPY
jgi:hypothetical protein